MKTTRRNRAPQLDKYEIEAMSSLAESMCEAFEEADRINAAKLAASLSKMEGDAAREAESFRARELCVGGES